MHEAGDSPFKRGPLHEDVPAAGLAAQADIRPEAVHEPRLPAAGVAAPEPDDVAQVQLEDGVA